MLRFNFSPKLSLIVLSAFVVFTTVGTLLHELGHIIVAEYLGYETKLYHGSMTYEKEGFYHDESYLKLQKLFENYKDYEIEDLPESILNKAEILNKNLKNKFPLKTEHDFLYVTIGGPVQTILTSIIGICILLYRRKKKLNFNFMDWLSVFLALFILREVFNFCSSLLSRLLYGTSNFNGDEFIISRYFDLNEWFFPSVTFVIGLLVSLYVIFRIIPLKFRFTFIISGFVGGLLGFGIWFGFLGELLFN